MQFFLSSQTLKLLPYNQTKCRGISVIQFRTTCLIHIVCIQCVFMFCFMHLHVMCFNIILQKICVFIVGLFFFQIWILLVV